jgi:nucleoside-diphosphate-sugar epimerase
VRLFITGSGGVLGRQFCPIAQAAGHDLEMPGRAELDLFDPAAVTAAVRNAGAEAVLHLATRIRPLSELGDPDAWRDNDRLRAEASAVLVDAALDAGAGAYIQPTVTFVYPRGPASEDTPLTDIPAILQSAVIAEEQAARFSRAGGRGVVLRLGLLDGPGTGHDGPNPALGATVHVADAARAFLAAITLGSGIYNVCRDGEPVSNHKFRQATGWRPLC